MSGDYLKRLEACLDAHRPDKARKSGDVIATFPNPDGRGWRHLTGEDLRAAVDELKQARAEQDETAPVMPNPRGPLYQRLVTDWHTVSVTSHSSWTDNGYEWDHEYDFEHPDECDLLPYGEMCLLDRVATLLGVDDEELSLGPRRARAHIYGPDMNGEFEERIEWGTDAESAPQQPERGGAGT